MNKITIKTVKWQLLLLTVLAIGKAYAQYPEYKSEGVDSKEGCLIPFYEYKAGMKFYFPDRKEVEYSDKQMEGYRFKGANDTEYKRGYYDMVAGKNYEIAAIQSKRDGNPGYVFLTNDEGDTLVFSFYHDLDELRLEKGSSARNLRLPYAISLRELDELKNLMAKHMDKPLYINFPFKGIKYQKVRITGISQGTEYKPVSIEFVTDSGEKGVVDVCICGTNLPPPLVSNCSFSKYFLTEDPQKDRQVDAKIWDQIMRGTVIMGMTVEEVILSLGKPNKAVKEVQLKEKTQITIVTMTYKNYNIKLEEGKVISIQKIEE